MVEEKTIRLSQVARKLNVATTTIAAYLLEKGFRVENKPNTKITLEQYKILAEEFADSAMDKEEAAELVIGQSYEKEPKVIAKQQEPIKHVHPKEKQVEIEKISLPVIDAPTIIEHKIIEHKTEEPPILQPELPTEEKEELEVIESPQAPQEELKPELETEVQEQDKEIQQELDDTAKVEQAPITKGPEKIDFSKQGEFKGVTVLGKIELAEKKEPKKISASSLI